MKGWAARQEQPAEAPEAEGTAEPEVAEADAADLTQEVPDGSVEGEEAVEAQDEGEGESQDSEEAVYELEVDGQTKRFTEEELRANILRTADYTRKTQELAEGRRFVEAQAEQLGQQRQALAQRLGGLAQQLESQLKTEDLSELQALRQTDPAEWGARMQERQARERAIQQARNEYESAMAQAREQHAVKEASALLEKTGWDQGKASQELSTLQGEICSLYGFAPEELASVVDHRFILLARDATQHRKAARQSDALKSKLRKLPKMQRPGAAGSVKRAEDAGFKQSLQKLKANGGRNIDDLAAAFKSAYNRRGM